MKAPLYLGISWMCKILSDLKLRIYKRLVRFQLNVA